MYTSGKMICPQCKAEYREGFTHCTDCDVDLVRETPANALADQDKPQPGDPNEDPFCSFWKGDDPRVHAELCTVLDEAGVPHNTVFRRDHLFNLSNFPSFEVGVPFSLFPKAELAVKEAFGTEDEDDRETLNRPRLIPEQSSRAFQKMPSQVTPSEEGNISGPPNAGDEWYSEDANVIAWTGNGGESSDFLVASLHENGIRCRVASDGDNATVYVLSEDASRAREIVREVVEGQPPE